MPATARFSFRHEVARKALHLLFAVVPIAYAAGFPRRRLVPILAVIAVATLAVELARASHDRIHVQFERLVGPLLRVHERDRWSGATWLVLSFLGLVAVVPREIAIAAMWAISVGDGIAALVGRLVGRFHYIRPGKTLIGSGACFGATLVGALAVAHLSLSESLIAATAATAAERPAIWIDDNVRIAVAVAAGILLWRITFS